MLPKPEECMPGTAIIYEGPADLVAQYQAIIRHSGFCGRSNVFHDSVLPRHPSLAASNPSSGASNPSTGPVCHNKKKGDGPCKSMLKPVFFTNLSLSRQKVGNEAT